MNCLSAIATLIRETRDDDAREALADLVDQLREASDRACQWQQRAEIEQAAKENLSRQRDALKAELEQARQAAKENAK